MDHATAILKKNAVIGREKEYAALLEAYTAARAGNGSVCFIHGEAGSGKTRLGEELETRAGTDAVPFITGKCFSGIGQPYGLFINCIERFIERYHARCYNINNRLDHYIRQELGASAGLIRHLHPWFGEIMPDIPDPDMLDPEHDHKRFIMVCGRFLGILADWLGGLVVFFDDLQWADPGSLELLLESIENTSRRPVLIIAAYRSEELGNSLPLQEFIRQARESTTMTELLCSPLSLGQTGQLIASQFKNPDTDWESLAGHVFSHSGGNPFYTIEIVKHLRQELIITETPEGWRINHPALKTHQIPETLPGIIMKRLAVFNDLERKLFVIASVIGKNFNRGLLLELYRKISSPEGTAAGTIADNETFDRIIEKALTLNIVHAMDDDNNEFRFFHDKIQEALHLSINDQERTSIHSTIARHFETNYRDGDTSVLFDLAHHAIQCKDDALMLEFVYLAAKKAHTSHAIEEAFSYYSIIVERLEHNNRHQSAEYRGIWVQNLEGMGETSLIIGRYDIGLQVYYKLIPYKHNTIELASIYKQLSTAYFKKGDWDNCEEMGRVGLSLIGEKLPIKKHALWISMASELLKHLACILADSMGITKKFPGSEDRTRNSLIVWYYKSLNWMYAFSNIQKFTRSTIRMLNISWLRLPDSREQAESMGAYACLLVVLTRFYRAGHFLARALAVAERIQDTWAAAQIQQWMGFRYQCMARFEKSSACLSASHAAFKNIGDSWALAISVHGLDMNSIYIGDYPNAINYGKQYINICHATNDLTGLHAAYTDMIWLHAERHDSPSAEEWISAFKNMAKKKTLVFNEFSLYAVTGLLRNTEKKYAEAIENLECARQILEKNIFIPQYSNFIFPELAEAHLMQAKKDADNRFSDRRDSRKIKRLCRLAIKKTRAWESLYGEALRVAALYQQHSGKTLCADKYYRASIKLQERIGRRYLLGKSLYHYGVFLITIGRNARANSILFRAFRIFNDLDISEYRDAIAALLPAGNRQLPAARPFNA